MNSPLQTVEVPHVLSTLIKEKKKKNRTHHRHHHHHHRGAPNVIIHHGKPTAASKYIYSREGITASGPIIIQSSQTPIKESSQLQQQQEEIEIEIEEEEEEE
ncbi:uncharacterized protein TM35_000251870, partial [Trypanosoma theileri]